VVHSVGGWAALAGLVAITSPCASVSLLSAIIIGAAAGIIVVLSVLFFDKIKIDDPVGAFYSGSGFSGGSGSPSATGEVIGQLKPVKQT
jgi:Amt family ammonium transporter